MKLLHHTTLYFAGSLVIILTVWAGLYYYNMLDEVYDSIDDGLDNYKLLIINKAQTDSTVLHRTAFDEANYAVHPISQAAAQQYKDHYKDTTLYMINEAEYEPVRLLTTAFKHHDHYYRLKIIASMVEEDDLIADLLYALLWLYAGVMVSVLLINTMLMKQIWKPFYRTLDTLKRFRLDDRQNIQLEKTRVSEFQVLNETLEKVLKANVVTYISQKHFIENAAHELQTPVAISLNKLELLAGQGNIPEDQLVIVESVMQNLQRLARLNKSLLLLSKIENQQFAHREKIYLPDVVTQVTEGFADLAAFKNIQITVNGTMPPVNMNLELAEIMVTNLIKNAIVHNIEGGEVIVTMIDRRLRIENSGTKPLEGEKIFKRFYKDTPSSSSTGLGLAIVKAIADAHQYQVRYTYQQRHMIEVLF